MKRPYGRTRGKLTGLLPDSQIVQTNTTRYNATPTSSTVTSYPDTLGYPVGDMMQDVVTPGFRTLSRKGKIINNPMSKFHRECVLNTFSGQWLHRNRKAGAPTPTTGTEMTADVFYTNRYAPINHPSYPTITREDRNALLQQAVNEAFASAHQRDVMGAVDIAEGDKTLDMLRTNLGRFDRIRDRSIVKKPGKKKYLSSGSSYQIYKPKTPAGVAADLAGLWLETQYGIIPLMLSIEGLIKALGKDAEGGQKSTQTYRGSESSSDFITKTTTVYSTGQLGTANAYRTDFIHSLDYNYVARAGVMTRYNPSLRERLGLTGRDLVPAAYELIKYSFVLDWFWDLGTYLEAVTPIKGFKSDASWSTLYLEEYETFEINNYSSSETTTYYEGYTNAMNVSTVLITRDRVRTPGVVPGIPNFDLKFRSIKHLISAAALVIARSRSKAVSRL